MKRLTHRALAGCRGSGEWFDTPAEAVAAVRTAALADGSETLPEEAPLLLFAFEFTRPARGVNAPCQSGAHWPLWQAFNRLKLSPGR